MGNRKNFMNSKFEAPSFKKRYSGYLHDYFIAEIL